VSEPPRGPLTLFLIAGEPSGDAIGARLMAALKARTGGAVRFAGVGGERMASEGLASIFPMSDISLFGAAEIIPKVPLILRRVRETVAAIGEARPDAVVSIDVPGFAFRVVERLRAAEFPRIHYVAPTVWAYRPGRARRIARFLDHLMVLLPFEPPYFEREGLGCTYVGHPVLEEGAGDGDGPEFRARHGIPVDAPLLAVLPGSRRSEVGRLLPIFGDAVARLAPQFPGLRLVVPTVRAVRDEVARATAGWAAPAIVAEGARDKYDAFAASDAALAASGTVSVELGLAGVPMVIAYRLNLASAVWLRLLLRVKYVTLINIVLDRGVVPEFLQNRCRPGPIAKEVAALLAGAPARVRQLDGIREAMAHFDVGREAPSARAAETVLEVIRRAGIDTLHRGNTNPE
jgi:lipid-A-disaccharide synthase